MIRKKNIDGLLKYCIDAKVRGIICFGIGLTLRDGDREYFFTAGFDRHFPNMKERYIYTYGNLYQLTSSNNNVFDEQDFRSLQKTRNYVRS